MGCAFEPWSKSSDQFANATSRSLPFAIARGTHPEPSFSRGLDGAMDGAADVSTLLDTSAAVELFAGPGVLNDVLNGGLNTLLSDCLKAGAVRMSTIESEHDKLDEK